MNVLRLCFNGHILITGGAGFVGSHIVDKLMQEGYEVTVLDNLGNSSLKNIERWLNNRRFTFIRGDLKDYRTIKGILDSVGMVFHFAADPNVDIAKVNPVIHFNDNLKATFNLMEAIKEVGTIEAIVFASTSAVYGEARSIPTPEDYGSLIPLSIYGASKLGCEALISAYACTLGLRALILRFANIVGRRATRGVTVDLFNKLKLNPKRLEILGDGSQNKSYLYIQDCIESIFHCLNHFLKSGENVQIFNIGSKDQITVKRIVEILVEELGLKNVEFSFTGGVEGGRGWPGDVKEMLLSINKMFEIGWNPKYSSEEAIRLAIRDLIDQSCYPI